jgi:hypothetical protein
MDKLRDKRTETFVDQEARPLLEVLGKFARRVSSRLQFIKGLCGQALPAAPRMEHA